MNATGVLVARTPAGWSFLPPEQDVPVPASVAEILELLAASELEAAAPGFAPMLVGAEAMPEGDERVVAPDAWIHPADGFLAVLAEGTLLVEGGGGEPHRLPASTIELLEGIGAGACAGDAFEAARAAGADLSTELRLLARVGIVQVFERDERDLPPAAEEQSTAHTAPPPPTGIRRQLRRGRRVLGRIKRHLRPPAATPEPLSAPTDDEGAVPGSPPVDEGAKVAGTPVVDDDPVVYLESPTVGDPGPGAIPIYAVFQKEIGPLLSLGMLTAAARHHDDGALTTAYDIRRPEDPASFLADLAEHPGPAILLLSNYIWSSDHNLDLARRAVEVNPELVVIHGGPNTPKYEADCEAYFSEHAGIVHVTVRSEGEATFTDLLDALRPGLPTLDLSRLAGVQGLTYLAEDGAVIRTEDRDRIAELDDLPSPYLTGEFDHLDPSAWRTYVTFETNRGCPYGCTFCDWGSSTLSRIRKFDLDRVSAELWWAGERKLDTWVLADANTGIMSRDIDVVDRLVEVKRATGVPSVLGFNVAKNTTKHLTKIVDRLVGAEVAPYCTLALQTRDEATLDAVARNNISTEHYTGLAASFRRRKLPLQADLMLGLPGQTVDSLTGDLHFLIEHEIPARIWITQMLPNSPMNEPEYRERWQVRTSGSKVVMSTASFTVEERGEMMRVRHAYTVFERFGLLRHPMRHLQWDHGVPISTLLRTIMDVTARRPADYPLLSFTMRCFDYFPLPPVGWTTFYAEVRRFLRDELGVVDTPALDVVFAVQQHLMPERGRELPTTLELDHDYVTYYAEATRNLWFAGGATGAQAPLASYGPGSLTVLGDPTSRCGWAMRPTLDDPRDETMNDAYWLSGHMELDSVLVRNYPEIATGSFDGVALQPPDGVDEYEDEVAKQAADASAARIGISSRRGGTATATS